jgi:hypothetical protein
VPGCCTSAAASSTVAGLWMVFRLSSMFDSPILRIIAQGLAVR